MKQRRAPGRRRSQLTATRRDHRGTAGLEPGRQHALLQPRCAAFNAGTNRDLYKKSPVTPGGRRGGGPRRRQRDDWQPRSRPTAKRLCFLRGPQATKPTSADDQRRRDRRHALRRTRAHRRPQLLLVAGRNPDPLHRWAPSAAGNSSLGTSTAVIFDARRIQRRNTSTETPIGRPTSRPPATRRPATRGQRVHRSRSPASTRTPALAARRRRRPDRRRRRSKSPRRRARDARWLSGMTRRSSTRRTKTSKAPTASPTRRGRDLERQAGESHDQRLRSTIGGGGRRPDRAADHSSEALGQALAARWKPRDSLESAGRDDDLLQAQRGRAGDPQLPALISRKTARRRFVPAGSLKLRRRRPARTVSASRAA